MPRAEQRPTSPRSKSALIRTAGALACAGALVVFPGAPAASETPPVQPGSALATASLARVDVIYGKFSFPFSVGDSRASYQTSESVAVSHGLNLGALNGSGGASPCDDGGSGGGGTPAPNQEPPFRPVTLSSRDGAGSQSYGTAPIAVGDVSVKVSPLSATSHTSSVLIDVPGVVTVKGHTDAQVAYSDGTQRAANADATIDLVLAGGLVRLKGLTWEASDSSGTKEHSTAGFSAASIVVGGQAQAVDTEKQLEGAIDNANDVLKLIGLAIDMPVTKSTDTNASVSGMVIHIYGSDALAALAGPIMDTKTPIQQAVGDLIRSLPDCNLNESAAAFVGTAELVVDVILGGLIGEGGIDLTLGGASAGTAPPPDFENPFGSGGQPHGGGGTPPGNEPPVVASGPVQGAPLPTGEVPQTPVVSGQPGTAMYTVGCASTNTADTNPCSSGASSKAFYALLLGALALFAGDLYQSRRPRPIVRRSVS